MQPTLLQCNTQTLTAVFVRKILASLQGKIAVALPEGIESIAPECFKNSVIEHIDLPTSLVVIGEKAFDGCVHLNTVNFAAGSQLHEIGNDAFSLCENLKHI